MFLPSGGNSIDIDALKDALGMNSLSNAISKIAYGSYTGSYADEGITRQKTISMGFDCKFLIVTGLYKSSYYQGSVILAFPKSTSYTSTACIVYNAESYSGNASSEFVRVVSSNTTSVSLEADVTLLDSSYHEYHWVAFG